MLQKAKSKNSENTAVSKNSNDDNKQSLHLLPNSAEITNDQNNLQLSSKKLNDESNNTLLMEELKELTESPTPFVSRQNTQHGAEMTSTSINKNSNERETAKTNTAHERNSQREFNMDACNNMMVAKSKIENTPHTEERENDEEEVVVSSICEAIEECESSVSDDISTISDDDIENNNANKEFTHESNSINEIDSVNEIMHHAACTAASRLNLPELQQENTLPSVENKSIMHIHEHYKLRHMLYEQEQGMHCTCFALAAPLEELEEWKQEHHKRQVDIESKRVYLAVGHENGAIHLYNTSFVEIGRCTLNTSSSSSSLSRLPSTLTRPWRQLMHSTLLLKSKSNKVHDNTETKQTAVRCMSIPLDERVLVAAYANKSVILWSLQTHSPLKVIHDVFDCPLRGLYHLHPYSNRIMCCDKRGAIHLLLYNIILSKVMTKSTFLIAAGASCAIDVIPMWTVSTKQEEEHEEEQEHLENEDTHNRVSSNVNANGVGDDSECMSTKYYYGKSFKISVDVDAGKQEKEYWHVVPNKHLVATVHDCYLSLYLVHSGLSASMHKVAEYTHASDWKRQSQRHATRDRYSNKINSNNENLDSHSQTHVQFIVQSPRFGDNNKNTWEELAVNNKISKRKISKNEKLNNNTNKRIGEVTDEVSEQETKIPITLCAAWGHEVVLFDVNSELISKSRTSESKNESMQLIPLLSIGSIHLLAEPSYMVQAMCVISGTCLLVVMTQPCSANNNSSNSKNGRCSVMNDALIFLIDVAAGLVVEKYHYNSKYIGMANTNKKVNSSDYNNDGERCRSAEAHTFKSTIAVVANREVVMLASSLHVWTCRVKPWNLRVGKLITRHRFEEALELLQEVVEEVALAAVRVPTSREELRRQCSVLLQEIAMAYVQSIIHTPNVEQFLYSKTQMEMLQRVMRRILSVCVTLDLMDVYYHHIIPCLVEHHLTCEAYMVLEEFIIKHVITSVPKEQLIILLCWIAEKCQDEKSCFISHTHDNGYMLNECKSQRRMENVLLNLNNNDFTTTLIDVAVQFHLVWARITLMALRQNKIVHALRVALTHDEHMVENACTSQVNKNNDKSNNFALPEYCNNCTKMNSLALLSMKYISCVLLDMSFVEYKQEKEETYLYQWERQMEEEWVRGMTLEADIRVHAKRELWSYLLSSSSSSSNTESPLLRLFALHPSATVEILLQSLKDNSYYSPWDAQSSAKAHQVQIEGVATLLELVTDGVVDKSVLFTITSDDRHAHDTNKINSTINDVPQINFIPEILAHKSNVPYSVIHKIIQTIVELLILVETPSTEHIECEEYEEEEKQQIQITSCMSYVKEWDLLTELIVRDYTFTFDNLTTLQERKQLQQELNKFIQLLVSRQNTMKLSHSYLLKLFTMKGMGICLAFLYCCLHKYGKAIDCVLDARMCITDEYLHYDVFEMLREELEWLLSYDKSNCVQIKSTVEPTTATSSPAIYTTLLIDWWHAIIERLPLLKATYANTFAVFVLQSIAAFRYKSHKGVMPSLLVTTDRKLFDYLHFLQECIKYSEWANSHSADNHEEMLFFQLLCNEYIQNYYIALMAEYSPNWLYKHIQELEKYNVTYDRTLAMQNASAHGIHDVEILILEQERKYDDAFALLQRIITVQLEQLNNEVRVKCCQDEECKKEVKCTNDDNNNIDDTWVKHAEMSEFQCIKELQHYIQVGAHLCESIMQHNTNICKNVKEVTTSFAEVRSCKIEQIVTNSNNEECYCYNKDSYWVKLLDCFAVPHHSLETQLHLIKRKSDVKSDTVTYTMSEINGNDQEHQLQQEINSITINNTNNNSNKKSDERCGDNLDVYFSQFDSQSCVPNNVNELKQNEVKCEEHQEEQEEELESIEAQLAQECDEHNDKVVTNIKNNEIVETSEKQKSLKAVVILTLLIACLTHLFEYTVECLLPFVNLPSLLLYLQDASVNEPLTFYKLSLVKTLCALHHHESLQELCCENTNESDDVSNKRLLHTGMNSGVVPLSDCCFLCHARLTDAANEELPKTMEMYLSTQRVIDKSGNTIYNNNSSSKDSKGISVGKLKKTHNANTSICVFHCGHVYHEVCQVRMSTACGENRCIVCLLEKEQEQQRHREQHRENKFHSCQDATKPNIVSIDTSKNNHIGNVNSVENGKTQDRSEMTKCVLRRLRQVNTLLNETSDYYNILKGYIEPDDTLSSSLLKRSHELQTTQKGTNQHKQKCQEEEHNVTKRKEQEPKSNNTNDKIRKVADESAVDDPHLLDLQIGKLTDDDILQLFDA